MRDSLTAALVLCGLAVAVPATAQNDTDDSVSLGLDPSLSLDPTAPQVGTLPGGMTPAYGSGGTDKKDWRFDFHGFIRAPLRMGINTRTDPQEGQEKVVYHAPPQVPDDLETFSHTGVVPTPYAQLNFSYGNGTVTGTAILLAEQASVSTGFFDPSAQRGISDMFLTIVPKVGRKLSLTFNVGAFTNRYGTMGEYDEGRYGTPLVARINGVGENISATFGVGDLVFQVEQGIVGQSNKAPVEIAPDIWNDYADPNVGSGLANHFHLGVGYRGMATLAGHYITAFSQDDRATGTLRPDGNINVLAGDLRLHLGRFGHFYGGVSVADAQTARSVGSIIQVLNTNGGPGLMQNYFGPDGDGSGKLVTLGAQYDVSLGKILSYPSAFYGDGPDIVLGVFGLLTKVDSDEAAFDNVTKRKFGFEVGHGWLQWLGYSLRFDRVEPDVDEKRKSFAVISPRLIFRTDWNSQDQVVLQYSRWLNGELTAIRTGIPPQEDYTVAPDEHMISLSGSLWW